MPRRKFSEILKKGTLQNPCRIILVVEFIFNKNAGMDSRPAFLLKKSFYKGWIFSACSVRSNVNSDFGKSAGCAMQGCTLLKRCDTINFLKNVLLGKLIFGTFSENNVEFAHCRLRTLQKQTPC